MKPEEVKAQFKANGISIRQWALEQGFNPRLVYAVLHGQVKGIRGDSHKIAVALGMKPKPNQLVN